MITEPTVYSDDQSKAASLNLELDFASIDNPTIQLHPFTHAILKLGQFLTTKEVVRREITETRLSQMMFRYWHKIHIHPYTVKEIREQLWGSSGEFRGGGVMVEWSETSSNYGRFQAHYTFTFSRILRPEDYMIPEASDESIRT